MGHQLTSMKFSEEKHSEVSKLIDLYTCSHYLFLLHRNIKERLPLYY